jgi:photosystem II stability/assembly factor-like uncharacterized protein
MKSKLLLGLISLVLIFPSKAQWNNQTSGVSNDLHGVYFLDSNTGWAVGRQGKIVRTTNGGSSWSEQNSSTTEDLNDVFMLNSSLGYAVGKKGKIVKFNGTSWSDASSGETRDVGAVYFLDANTGFAVGDWGRLYRTNNGGTSWANQNHDALRSNYYQGVYMFSTSSGFAVGTSGRIVRYNGSQWNNVTSGTTVDLLDCHFLNENYGFAVGRSSTILFWNGTSWSQHNSDLPANNYAIHDVHIINSSLAYAVAIPGLGGAGRILRYDGNTWKTDYEFTGMGTEFFYSVHFPSSNVGYAVGSGGLIRKKGTASTSVSNYNASEIGLNAYPNPFNNTINISFELEQSGKVKIEVIDITGRVVGLIKEESMTSGKHQLQYDAAHIPHGLYFVRITAGDNHGVFRISKL